MKKKLSKLTLVVVAMAGMILLNSCGDKQVKSNESQEQGLISVDRPMDKKVNYRLAMECVKLYIDTPINTIKKTESVTFNKDSLRIWIDSLDIITDYDQMVIRFGVYKPAILIGQRDRAAKLNKLTVFLCPTLKGEPAMKRNKKQGDDPYVEPFNMGEVHP